MRIRLWGIAHIAVVHGIMNMKDVRTGVLIPNVKLVTIGRVKDV